MLDQMLKDRVAIITGSGRGIGKAAAIMLAKSGAKVVISDIDPEPAQEVVTEIQDAGGEAISYIGDVTGDDFANNIINCAAQKWGAIHIIINNAGFTWDSMIHKMTDKQWNTIIDLHLKAPFRIIRAAKPWFCDAAKKEIEKRGKAVARKIINISSISGTTGNAGQANYSAAKSGMIGLTKTMSKEWGRYNVQCNAIAFGAIDTRLSAPKEEGASMEKDGEVISLGIPKQIREIATMMIPLGRLGTPQEAAGPILFLASHLSDYVSGEVITVSGGL
ncbi:MAG: SDR family oxidoreductase [Desulfamplus sp.]|nr:SDR family oxidoreductase [Desulfamplus sp.]